MSGRHGRVGGPVLARPGGRSEVGGTRAGRTRAMTVVVIAALLLALAGGMLGRSLWLLGSGNDALRRGDLVTARARFDRARHPGLIETWKAPYDTGVADYSLGSFDAAAADFEDASKRAPQSEQCRVRLNWAWSLEAAADRLAKDGRRAEALVRWRQGLAVLADVKCSAQDSGGSQGLKATRRRLDGKRTGNAGGSSGSEGTQDSAAARQAELERRQRSAQEERQRQSDAATTKRSPGSGQGRTW